MLQIKVVRFVFDGCAVHYDRFQIYESIAESLLTFNLIHFVRGVSYACMLSFLTSDFLHIFKLL